MVAEAVKSKVKSVQANGSWESNYGVLYTFEYEFEDGTAISANHKTQDGNFKEGEEIEYTITGENEYGKRGKVQRFNNDAHRAHATNNYTSNPTTKMKGNNSSFALSYAKDLYVPLADKYVGQEQKLADEILIVAERFNTWLNNN